MSALARWILGLAAVGFAGMCVSMVLSGLIPQNPWLMWVIAAICLMIAIVCVPGRHGRIFGRILAGIGGASCLAYLAVEIVHPDQFVGRSSPSLVGALIMCFAWGLPALWYAATGRLGFGRLGEVSDAIANPKELEPEDFDKDEEVFTPKGPDEPRRPALH